MQLSKRLNTIARMVSENNRVADVGCDHAYTSIFLVEHKIAPKVVAMDVNQGPIDRAKENIKKYGYDASIDIRKSDGLDALQGNEVDTILIAGMGGALINRILTKRPDIISEVKELVLQPQSEIAAVRRSIYEMGFLIIQEDMIKEDGKYYVMLKAHKKEYVIDSETYELNKDEHYAFGRLLLEDKNSILLEFLQKEERQYEAIHQNLLLEASDKALTRQLEIKKELQLIKKGLCYFM